MTRPRITICIPHWQSRAGITLCLRSIRKHSDRYDIDVIVVDNGSTDDSLDYLRSLNWIQLIERPEESPRNWPRHVFTAWDRGLQDATGAFYLTMHADVFVKADDWLDPFLREMDASERVAGVGAWKLDTEHPLYLWQKHVLGAINWRIKSMLGRKRRAKHQWTGQYPRDYCAMYRTDVLRDRQLQFDPLPELGGGGRSIAKRIWDAGYETRMIPVPELARKIEHIAHGTAAISADKTLRRPAAQRKVEKRAAAIFAQPWMRELETNEALDR